MPVVVVGSLLGLTSSADTALERIPVALVNNDELVETTNDDGEEEIILASKPLITELVSGDGTEVEWVITSTEAANTLLAAGEVYAIFEIPADFSAAVSTLGGSNPEQAQFTVRTDPSRSYLAGVLGDQVGDSIARALSVEFAEAATEGLFTVIVDLGDAFEEAADAATELAEGTEEFAEGMSELAAEMPDLDDGASDLASGYATFDDGLGDYADGVTALSDGLDALSAGTSGLGALSSGISDYTAGSPRCRPL
jgi:putative membrane protein